MLPCSLYFRQRIFTSPIYEPRHRTRHLKFLLFFREQYIQGVSKIFIEFRIEVLYSDLLLFFNKMFFLLLLLYLKFHFHIIFMKILKYRSIFSFSLNKNFDELLVNSYQLLKLVRTFLCFEHFEILHPNFHLTL